MLLRLLISKGVSQLSERVGFIDDRLHVVCLDRRNHISLIQLTAHGNTAKPAVLRHQCCSRYLSRPTGEHADQADAAIHRQRADRLRQITRAADFHHEIDACAPGQLKRLLPPVGVGLIINQVLGAQRAESLQLCV